MSMAKNGTLRTVQETFLDFCFLKSVSLHVRLVYSSFSELVHVAKVGSIRRWDSATQSGHIEWVCH